MSFTSPEALSISNYLDSKPYNEENHRTPVSGIYNRTYTPEFTSEVLKIESSDLHTLLITTGSQSLLAVSSGAPVAMYYLATHPTPFPTKTILFEPPLFLARDQKSIDFRLLARFERERALGDEANSLVTANEARPTRPAGVGSTVVGQGSCGKSDFSCAGERCFGENKRKG